MTVRLQIGKERYTVKDGTVTPEADNDPFHQARAEYFTTIAPTWLDKARRTGEISLYTPNRDCTVAQIIAYHMLGKFECDPPPDGPTDPDTVF